MISLTVALFLGSDRSSLVSRCRHPVDRPFSFMQLCRSTYTISGSCWSQQGEYPDGKTESLANTPLLSEQLRR